MGIICLVFRLSKDLYLVITQKLIILKSGGFHMKNLINQMLQQKLFSLGVQGGYDPGFHEILGHSLSLHSSN